MITRSDQGGQGLVGVWRSCRPFFICGGAVVFALSVMVLNFPNGRLQVVAENLTPPALALGLQQNWRLFVNRVDTVYAVRLDVIYQDGTFVSEVVREPRVSFTRSGVNRQMEYISFEGQASILSVYMQAQCAVFSQEKPVQAITFLRAPLSVEHLDDVPLNSEVVRYLPFFHYTCGPSPINGI